ncbi:hypothetical protein GcC1_103005 [Golovinomyces cichoracearum]|uniref:C2H2-type domain-containing protein n=1 Tax=Golovinomyces cichoracearum TaxID=62708 RepID=A0A420I9S5_9PEZI|nr:hypothetical protein GcC1_103005 [Golovinomyces cichoracearum]
MDTQFHPNNMNGNNSNYHSLPGISPHQLQQNSNLPTHTLPPLQTSPHSSVHSMYSGSAPQTPRTLATPNTPTTASSINFPQMSQTSSRFQLMPYSNQQPRNYQVMSNGNEQNYRAMSNMVPQSSGTTSMSYPQSIAPAPQNRMPQTIRPLSQNGMHMQGAVQAPYGQNNLISQMGDVESPTHVVGSQGRRGILPSAPGRLPVTSNTGKGTLIPAKDADGKFPCPHCTKTYLHAKHLKRHLLRHTGDRPYMCILCRDTFSRSDILKRHFQKCSLRRGNPTGASHLSHSQAHLKKSQSNPQKGANENGMTEVNGVANSGGGMATYGVAPDGTVSEATSNLVEQQADQVQGNSSKRLSSAGESDGRGMMGMNSGTSNRPGVDPNYSGTSSSTMPSSMNPSLAYSMPQGQNGHSYNQVYNYVPNGNNTNALSNQRPEIQKKGDALYGYNKNPCQFRETQGQV